MLSLRLLGNCTVTQLNYLCKYRAVQCAKSIICVNMSGQQMSAAPSSTSAASSASDNGRPPAAAAAIAADDDAKRMVTFLEHIGKLKVSVSRALVLAPINC